MPEVSFERRIDARLIASVAAAGLLSCAGVVVETAMNVAFPLLMSEFDVPTSSVQWVTTAYLLVLAVIVPLSAYLKRRFRTKALFVAAVSLFVAGTFVCMLAPTFPVLIAGRIVQGVGTGLALPLMFNIVIEQAPFEHMGMMMGIATLITAVAPAIGPSLGGALVAVQGWRAVFAALLPFLAVSFALGIWAIRQVGSPRHVPFSAGQFAVAGSAFACLVFAANAASSYGWLSARVAMLLFAAAGLIALFVLLARRSTHPLVDVAIFCNASFSFSVGYVVLFQAVVLGLGYLIPYYAQVVAGMNELAAGCLLLPACIVGALLAPFGGRFLDAFGPTRPIMAGACLQVAGLGAFFAWGTSAPVGVLGAIYLAIPLAQGLSMANAMTNGLGGLPESARPDGNAAFNTVQQLGGALGTAAASSVVGAAQTGASDAVAATAAGVHDAYLVLWCLTGAAFACAAFALACRRSRAVRR